ncbi:DUF2190 family protein [Desulfovibrio oxyclinae]|uniref:DUF2190 family protein n=1 Tax=Desulfovibrio oxyclinae TaxID=63560 RepID=UPI0003798E05|nr:DUF2190 family protein [Desulfovibrio oxyclinae]
MSQTYIRDGRTMPYENSTGSNIASGQAVLVGSRVGIAISDIPDGESGPLAMTGVHALPKVSADDAAQGGKAYMKTTGEITTTASGNTLVGFFFASAAPNETECLVAINAMNA